MSCRAHKKMGLPHLSCNSPKRNTQTRCFIIRPNHSIHKVNSNPSFYHFTIFHYNYPMRTAFFVYLFLSFPRFSFEDLIHFTTARPTACWMLLFGFKSFYIFALSQHHTNKNIPSSFIVHAASTILCIENWTKSPLFSFSSFSVTLWSFKKMKENWRKEKDASGSLARLFPATWWWSSALYFLIYKHDICIRRHTDSFSSVPNFSY